MYYEVCNNTITEAAGKEAKEKGDSFTDKLVTKIIDNLQVTVNKIHIRYEDEKDGQVLAPIHLNSLIIL